MRAQCDKLALHHGKRCVLWDDDGGGFCLWLNWDWAANRPATVDPDDKRRRVCSFRKRAPHAPLWTAEELTRLASLTAVSFASLWRSFEPGWYQNVKEMFQAPLLDASVGEERLGEWIDANTMRCHRNLLPLLAAARRGDAPDGGAAWTLDDPYQATLDACAFEPDD